MASAFGWIDFSKDHRDKVRSVLDSLSGQGVIDELGIGQVRDAFADRMFPGLSTIQTRPKYFTLTAFLLKRYEQQECGRRSPKTLEQFLDKEERQCRIRLVERHGADRGQGIIGVNFGTDTKRDVVRKPSSVYWAGLGAFGIVQPRGLSIAEFGKRVSSEFHNLSSLMKVSGEDRWDDADALDQERSIGVNPPEVADDYLETLSIDLTRKEATFLRGRIERNQGNSLIGKILQSDDHMEEFLSLKASSKFETMTSLAMMEKELDDDLRETVIHARKFWQLLYGAHIRYNCLLQEKSSDGKKREEFEELWKEWREKLGDYLEGWNTEFMWKVVSEQRRNAPRHFIDEWLKICEQGAEDTARCDELVRCQEFRNKGKRARLAGPSVEGINDWTGLKAVEYRFAEVYRLIEDVKRALAPVNAKAKGVTDA